MYVRYIDLVLKMPVFAGAQSENLLQNLYLTLQILLKIKDFNCLPELLVVIHSSFLYFNLKLKIYNYSVNFSLLINIGRK